MMSQSHFRGSACHVWWARRDIRDRGDLLSRGGHFDRRSWHSDYVSGDKNQRSEGVCRFLPRLSQGSSLDSPVVTRGDLRWHHDLGGDDAASAASAPGAEPGPRPRQYQGVAGQTDRVSLQNFIWNNPSQMASQTKVSRIFSIPGIHQPRC